MKTVKLAVGQKVFVLNCNENDIGHITDLATKLNIIVNKNSLKYKGLSPDTLLLISALGLIEKLEALPPSPPIGNDPIMDAITHVNNAIAMVEDVKKEIDCLQKL